MADSKEVVAVGSERSPGFIEELLPCSQQISLLYHISYLCLAKFPKLESLLRMRAVETQVLFGSSEAVLLKCVGTIHNLISSLFPMLTLAIEKNKPTVAVKYLEKARTWITETIQNVDTMVERYVVLNKDVATTTSDIISEKKETETKISKVSQETEGIVKTLKVLEGQLNDTTKQTEEKKRQIEAKNQELQNLVRSAASKCHGLYIFAAIVPFSGILVKAIYNAATGPDVSEKTEALEAQLNRLISEKNSLEQMEWKLQIQTIDWNMKLAKLKIDQGAIPDPVHLVQVQQYLSKLQSILIKLKGFWENVFSLLGTIKDKTFVGEEIVDENLKEEFLQSIQKASVVWEEFRGFCIKGVQIFREQSENGYKFLEINPASLSQEVWQKEYNRVKEQLLQVKVLGEEAEPAIQSVTT